jgi:hypothetical protein
MTEGIPPSGETATVVAETATAEVSEGATVVPEKCTLQFVLIATLRPMSHLSRLKEDRFTAGTAFQTTGNSNFHRF